MAPLKFHKVVGFSSEDHQFPASNLLSKGKWKCKEEGEKQAWVCLQLEELSTITNIDIGNNGAAFVEVRVGRNGCDEEMKVLLVASSFMSVNEARVGDNGARVRMFGADKMAAEVAKEKWDIVKVIATQPFNKHSKYGISFISLTGPPKIESKVEPKKEQVSSLGAFKLKDESESDIYIGSYFARKKENPILSSPSPSTVAAVMRSDTTLAEMTLHAGKREDKKRKQVELTPAARDEIKKRRVDKGRDFPSRLSLPGEIEEPSTSNKKEIIKKEKEGSVKKEKFKEKEKSKENEKLKENSSAKNTPQKEGKKKPHNKQKYGRFNEFLKGVNFAISGFQNPLRGEIRQKALDMGAKYSGDWNNSCTHLVCAFANTPKFNQVRGKGKIVKKEWIEECYTQRKRLPWRRFCLDRNDQNKAESEEELWEEVTAGNNDYDCDTDEEIERIKNEEEKENRKKQDKKGCTSSPATSKTKTKANDCDNYEEIEGIENKEENDQRGNQDKMDTPSTSKTNINAYDCDTDEEDTAVNKTETQDPSKDNNSSSLNKGKEKSDVFDPYDVDTDVDDDEVERLLPNTSQLQLENLPSFYEYQTFFLHKGMKEEEKVLLNRYIIACGGEVKSYMDSSVKNVIAKELTSKELREARDVNGKINFILPTWVFACHSEGRLLNCNDYLLQQ